MTAWFTPKKAEQIKSINPEAKLLAGLTVNWVWDNQEWVTHITTVANFNRKEPIEITDDVYLHNSNGERCAFGCLREMGT